MTAARTPMKSIQSTSRVVDRSKAAKSVFTCSSIWTRIDSPFRCACIRAANISSVSFTITTLSQSPQSDSSLQTVHLHSAMEFYDIQNWVEISICFTTATKNSCADTAGINSRSKIAVQYAASSANQVQKTKLTETAGRPNGGTCNVPAWTTYWLLENP